MCNVRFIFFSFFLVATCSVFGQERTLLKGRVVDFVTYQAVAHTCIHNISTGLMTFSNASGDFSMIVKNNDTLAISRVGYSMDIYIIDDSIQSLKQRITFRMITRSIMLREVTIHAMKPYPLFVQDLVKTTPQQKIEIPNMEISPEERANYDINKGNLLQGTPLASPITYLYEKFSHKAKMGRMYASLIENQEEVIRLTQKYNPNIVQRITRLEGEQLEDFMLYCSFTYYTLVISTDMQIEKMIIDKYLQYKRENGI